MTKSNRIARWTLLPSLGLLVAVFSAFPSLPANAAQFFKQTNLVTDDPLINPAQQTDPNLKNAWGISFSPTGPFWVSDNGTGLTTLYNVNPASEATAVVPLVVTIPGAGTVTGQVFNGTTHFNNDAFLFVSEDGTVSGWRGALGTTAETLVLASAANVYIGNGGAAGSTEKVYFSAGPNGEKNGLFGVIQPGRAYFLPLIER
jgi:hypothetical protein